MSLTRRALLSASLVAACTRRASVSEPDLLEPIERSLGGRVGVFALDTASGRSVAHRPDERFAMCSTFKWALAAAVLRRVDRGELSLAERVRFSEKDLLEYAPVTRAKIAEGEMSLEALAEASVVQSDNTAANLLLVKVGGPVGWTSFMREQGDTVSRLDRNEPTLNLNVAGDPRDTTSPRAMAQAMQKVLVGAALAAGSRERLLGWMRACTTGHERLRAGLPPAWSAGDKTGTCNNGAHNDVAIAWPPARPPILIAAYLSDSSADAKALNAAHAEIARAVVRRLW